RVAERLEGYDPATIARRAQIAGVLADVGADIEHERDSEMPQQAVELLPMRLGIRGNLNAETAEQRAECSGHPPHPTLTTRAASRCAASNAAPAFPLPRTCPSIPASARALCRAISGGAGECAATRSTTGTGRSAGTE